MSLTHTHAFPRIFPCYIIAHCGVVSRSILHLRHPAFHEESPTRAWCLWKFIDARCTRDWRTRWTARSCVLYTQESWARSSPAVTSFCASSVAACCSTWPSWCGSWFTTSPEKPRDELLYCSLGLANFYAGGRRLISVRCYWNSHLLAVE